MGLWDRAEISARNAASARLRFPRACSERSKCGLGPAAVIRARGGILKDPTVEVFRPYDRPYRRVGFVWLKEPKRGNEVGPGRAWKDVEEPSEFPDIDLLVSAKSKSRPSAEHRGRITIEN